MINEKQQFDELPDTVLDLLVVGGGVVGLSILRSASIAGYSCALVEKEPHLLSWASGSNSGIVCTGVDALPGTLERALIRDSIAQIRPYCKRMNVPTRECGSLVCLWEGDDTENLDEVLKESLDAGDTHACRLNSQQVHNLEPNINKSQKGAVHIPGEIVIDPWLYSVSLAAHARQNGARIFTNFEMDFETSYFDGHIWTVTMKNTLDNTTTPGVSVRANIVISAMGLWADNAPKDICTLPFTVCPRRGQYRVFSSNSTTAITHPIQPCPTQFSKGIFVFSTIYDHIVVGPTALDQKSRTDRTVDDNVSNHLEKYIEKIIPCIDLKNDYIGDYVGIRPGTDKRDYQIIIQFEKHWITCAGIRSTGLTASLGIGRYMLNLLQQSRLLKVDQQTPVVVTKPLPSVSDLAHMFWTSKDAQSVMIDGHMYKVTHPLTRYGFSSMVSRAVVDNS